MTTYTYDPNTTTLVWTVTANSGATVGDSWRVGRPAAKRRGRARLTALVAIGHATFFLALALAGWLR